MPRKWITDLLLLLSVTTVQAQTRADSGDITKANSTAISHVYIDSQTLSSEVRPDLQEIVRKLAGSSSRTWVLNRSAAHISGNDCSRKERYTFHIDKTLVIRRCEGGNSKEVTVPWILGVENEIDVTLQAEGRTYVVRFQKKGKKEYLVLRSPAHIKTEATVDSVFVLEK